MYHVTESQRSVSKTDKGKVNTKKSYFDIVPNNHELSSVQKERKNDFKTRQYYSTWYENDVNYKVTDF